MSLQPHSSVQARNGTIYAHGMGWGERGSVVIESWGRIGNQLFIIAAGYVAARTSHRELLVDLSSYSRPAARHQPEALGFDWSFPDAPVFGVYPRQGLDRYRFRGARRLNNALARVSGSAIPATLRARGAGLEPRLMRSAPYGRILGRFQAAAHVVQACQLGFPRRLEPVRRCPWLAELEQQAREEAPVVVVVRLGDYRRHSATFGNLTRDYYANGLRVSDPSSERPIWLFCDEAETGLQFLPSEARDRTWVVPQPADEPKEHVLLAASHGTSYVIANSTFAWWAAWMSGPASQVVLPDPWFRVRSPEGIAPPEWQAVPAAWVSTAEPRGDAE